MNIRKNINKILNKVTGNDEITEKEIKTMIKVTFPSYSGDESKMMTIQELKQNYKDYLILDPSINAQVNMDDLLNLKEVIVMPPIAGG